MKDTSDPAPPANVAGVILAAGRSRRMPGRSKLLRGFRGEPVVRAVARTALDAGLEPVIVCMSSGLDSVASAVEDLPVRTLSIPGGAEGVPAGAGGGV